MIKLFILMFCMILLVGSVSAFEFDNVKTFNETDRSLVVHNSFNLPLIGSDIAKITPLTPHVVSTFPGRNQTVARFYIENYVNDYDNVWKDMEFYNIKNNNVSENRKFHIKYETVVGTKEKPIYEINCTDEKLGNGTIIENCIRVILRYETVDVTEWKDLDISHPLPKGNYTIKIITDVYIGDHMEFIPTWFGVRMLEYSEWTASLNDELVFYYNFEQGEGSALPDVTGNLPNGTLLNMEDSDWTTGIIGNGLNFSGVDESANTTYRTSYSVTDNFSISFWYNSNESVSASKEFFGTLSGDGSAIGVEYSAGLLANYRFRDAGNNLNIAETSNFNDGLWHMHTIVRDTSLDTYNIYFDSISENNGTDPAVANINFNDASFFLSARGTTGAPTTITLGEFDEFGWWNRSLTPAEVIQLYNGGTGITFNSEFSPAVTLNSPVEAFNSSNQTIDFNGSVSSATSIINVSLFIDGIFNETNSSGINNADYFFTKTLSDGNHNWTYESCAPGGCANATTRNFTIDTTAPILNVTFPTIIIGHHLLNNNLSVNWTIIDPNLDTCILEFEGVNRTVTCLDNSTEINITNSINRSIIFYINDTFGNSNFDSRSWFYRIFENNQTFNENVLEGNTETFTANIIVNDSNPVSTVNLFYNGTPSTGSFSLSGNETILTKSFQIPQVDTETNITFFWNVQLSEGQSINITPHNQTISSLSLDNCSVNTFVLYNYTIVDEGNQSQLSNTTAEINVNILDSSREIFISNFTKLYSDVNPFGVCLNIDIESSSYSVDSVVKYQSLDYAIEYYNIVNSTLTNSTIPFNITLFDLFGADSTEFKISFKGEDFVFVENALIFIDRQYISENNTFKTVELPKTDSNGKTVGHFVRNDVVYNIRVIKDSIVLGNFNNIIAFCQDFTIGDCQIVLEATPSSQSTFDYDSELGIIFQAVPTYSNTTNAVSFSYSTDDGTSKTVFLEVTRSDIFGNRSICNNSLNSASGTLSCNVDPNIDETELITKVYVDGRLTVLSNIILDNSSIYGNLAYTLWFFLTFVFILGFGSSKTEVLIGLVVSLIGAISLGLVRGDIVGLGSAGIWMIVIVLLGIWKLNKENPQ